MPSLSLQFIVEYVSQFGETFSKVLAIRPSGWEKKASKPNFANRISILGVQYSEHSSYNELERFVRFLRPKKVISTVPFSSQNMSRTPKVPDSWLNPKLEPKSQPYQRNIMDYMVKVRKREREKERLKRIIVDNLLIFHFVGVHSTEVRSWTNGIERQIGQWNDRNIGCRARNRYSNSKVLIDQNGKIKIQNKCKCTTKYNRFHINK